MSDQRQIVSWVDFVRIHDDVEKLIYPLEVDDEHDCGKINEVHSQIDVFQGALTFLNESASSKSKDKQLTLPAPKATYVSSKIE